MVFSGTDTTFLCPLFASFQSQRGIVRLQTRLRSKTMYIRVPTRSRAFFRVQRRSSAFNGVHLAFAIFIDRIATPLHHKGNVMERGSFRSDTPFSDVALVFNSLISTTAFCKTVTQPSFRTTVLPRIVKSNGGRSSIRFDRATTTPQPRHNHNSITPRSCHDHATITPRSCLVMLRCASFDLDVHGFALNGVIRVSFVPNQANQGDKHKAVRGDRGHLSSGSGDESHGCAINLSRNDE